MHKRTMKVLKSSLGQINKGVTLWVSQLGAIEHMRASGETISDVEAKARELYKQKRVVIKLSYLTIVG